MPKITPREESNVVKAKTRDAAKTASTGFKWWKANSRRELCEELLSTVNFLKEQQQYRYRQAAIYARMYGNMPLFNFVGSSLNKQSLASQLPVDRPTMNVVQSCVDTLVSRISQSRPRPLFLTDNGDYKERTLAKQMNTFISGELYQTGAYELAKLQLRDAACLGTGCLKVFENIDKRIAIERVLLTELLVDPNDAYYGDPRQLHQLKLVDKSQLKEFFPDYRSDIEKAEQAFPDNSADSQKTIADQVMIVESWHLPSSKTAGDGRHVIACTSGVILDEEYTKDQYPFVFLHYSPRITGFWGQGLPEQLMGTQVEINRLLQTISQAINIVGVPRVFVEDGSKIVKAHLSNVIGQIVTYRGTKPVFEVAPCVPAELYAQLERLVQYSYQQSGISALAATSQKPAGLNSGEAIRNYDDLQSDRFATLNRSYDNIFVDLSYQIIDLAKEIVEREGSYSTVYPSKDGVKEIDLKHTGKIHDSYVVQCFDASSLPKDPSGRLEKVTEMMQAGLLSPQEGRRLLDYPDIEQVDKLANAQEERVLRILDEIVEEGKYTPPDPFMDLALAQQLVTQYYNLYSGAKLEEKKAQLLRDFFSQIQDLQKAAMPPPVAQPSLPQQPQAIPQSRPTSDILPQISS